ncbi:transketolase [bacterium]|nr:transketolase [bacterium]
MAPLSDSELAQRALRVREHCIRMATDGGCFLGASLSCVDLIVHLYARVLTFDPARPDAGDRDVLLLSKGHDVPALYGTFAEMGVIEPGRLANHLSPDDHIYWHPNRAVPGIEFHSGSLGHLLSVAIGVALDIKLRDGGQKVVVILGDGECNEGSVWEGALVAAAHRLDNLIAVVDRNRFQANIETEQLVPLDPLAEKFRAFGWWADTCDGHDFGDLDRVFDATDEPRDRPAVVVAETVRGKGLPSIEARADRWFCNFTHEEIAQLLRELRGGGGSDLTSEPLVVR